ncbi:hypothetical protein FT663_01189 [Candidozyma haemuli var. vulneris]|uniref:S-adenosyl-L-methionine-dependent tRNA 4-demethylwyosine synthase n=1 Tax=Candidozyma haemuli TaxID=45357 RepID=A0A2V1AY86_9ASCO|nr:hypothetical protein CXQ85_005401 [[Candida] haemuloni]KAF3992352.1 hypothetical protein FT662_01224 [[Candida] haemuloni var. vulneris]KAF3994722.1 hypothetical protein FT663_01189 [[Candida] haemuloni var. vulneris]PVH22719.1 hypothetical protein CXQ85_005401 [[Candida] haemuloni]
MASGTPILALCSLIYWLSGGRTTVLAAAWFAVFVHKQKKHDSKSSPITEPVKSSRIMEVDFTNAFTPETKTTFPKTVPLKKKTRKTRTAKVFKAKPGKSVGGGGGAVSHLTASSVHLEKCPVYIFYTTLTGSSLRVAKALHEKIAGIDGVEVPPRLLSLDDDVDDLEEYFLRTPKSENPPVYLLVLPSYETDSPIDYFLEHLTETYQDFRVDKYPLRTLAGFAVLGLGDSESWGGSQFCYQAKSADKWLGKLGARRLFPVGEVCMKHEGEPKTQDWINGFSELLVDEQPFLLEDDPAAFDSDAEEAEAEAEDEKDVVDVEDMGAIIRASKNKDSAVMEPKQMVAEDSPTYKSLTKQGYTIVGSHSGVKICRWTKSAMRGRGSCYKFAFYGIKSHLCMETTPSLACSNKCVFCWRHGTNPVAKSNWRWEVDPPEKVLFGALEGHYKKIKQMRGVPGIQIDRFQEAFRVRHCALSLVGEPIFYPHINEFVGMLHERHISSFLVCNAQHPEPLANLAKVTQLYVSIDAPTKTDLKKVDRPLNSDFWERLMSCLDIVRTIQSHQRTVFRLTLVKGFNMTEVESYADMVERAMPSQIEVKGATFCGSSTGNGNPLTMQNIPFLEECRDFCRQITAELQRRGLDYELAAEHSHSCCILIAHTKFKINNVWHTHIDYPKFFELLESGQEFCDLDYICETPEWAVWGAEEGGFNPKDTRYDRKAEKLKKKQARDDAAAKALQVQKAESIKATTNEFSEHTRELFVS